MVVVVNLNTSFYVAKFFTAACFSLCVRSQRQDDVLKKGCHVDLVNIMRHVKFCNVFCVIAFR